MSKALELAEINELLGNDYLAAELRRLAAVEAERDALKAELDRIRAMEPVAWILESGDGSGRYLTWGKPENYIGTPLYTLEKP